MKATVITLEELISDVEESLKTFNITLQDFAAADLDDYEDWDLRDIWLMFHQEVVESRKSNAPVAA
ncbi:MAG: hypothetical protein RIR34_1288 [Actinomycetota bacterium]